MTNDHVHDSDRHVTERDKLVQADDAVRDTSDLLLSTYGFNSTIGQLLNTLIISNDTGSYLHLIQGVTDHFFDEHNLVMPPTLLAADQSQLQQQQVTAGLTIQEHIDTAAKLQEAFILTEEAEVSLAISDLHPTLKTEASLVQFNLSLLINELADTFDSEHPDNQDENPYRTGVTGRGEPILVGAGAVVKSNVRDTVFETSFEPVKDD